MKVKKIYLAILLISAVYFLMPKEVVAITGEEIMRKVRDIETPKTSIVKTKMILVNKNGEKRLREILSYFKDEGKDQRKAMIRFIQPADVKGMGFLMLEHPDRDNDQFIYMPELKKVRRIASGSEQRGSFFGSDLTYEDMERKKIEDYTYNLLREEEVDSFPTYVVESIPNNPEDTSYSKSIQWIRKDNFILIKAELYNKRAELWKTISVNNVEKTDGYWMAKITKVTNVLTNHQTIVELSGIKNNKPIPDEYFTERYLAKE